LSNNKDKSDDSFQKTNLPKSWYSGNLAPRLDIEKLIQQLTPWLKSAAGNGENQAILALPLAKQDNTEPNSAPYKTDVTGEQVLNMADIEQSLDFSFGFEPINKPTAEAMDLNQYAENQGSAELATFMLDEYLADISINIQALSSALAVQDYRLALALLQSLTTLANVIAARALLAQCRQLSQLLGPKVLHGTFSVQEKEALQRQLNHLKLCLLQLTEFAEAI
jgi:HPt (histidine-containing phosphotransfer) domain-containing protein